MTKRLGRGLAELIQSAPNQSSSFVMLRTDQIRASRFQPRGSIDAGALEELKASIKKSGVIEPVIVRPVAHGTYELVAGERRLRASEALGIAEVPAVVKMLSDKEALEFSLIENVQRENLNPVEEAKGYARLLEEFGYTQEDVATAVGKDRATVANLIRILGLADEICEALESGGITLGHAKVLLSIEDRTQQKELFQRAVRTGISVRQLESLVSAGPGAGKRRRPRRVEPQARALEEELQRALGTRVRIVSGKKGGRITIEYFSQEDFNRVLQLLGVSG